MVIAYSLIPVQEELVTKKEFYREIAGLESRVGVMLTRALEAQDDRFDLKLGVYGDRIVGVEENLDVVDARLDAIKKRLTSLEKSLDTMEKRLTASEERLDAIENRLASLEKSLDTLEAKFNILEAKFDSLETTFNDFIDGFEARLDSRLEFFFHKYLPESTTAT